MGKFVVAHDGSGGGIVMTSGNGIAWAAQTGALSDSGFTVAYGAGLFVVGTNFAASTEAIMTSPDGINWTARSSPADGELVQKIIYAGGQFVAL